jgi:hypothetical protein
MQLTKDRPGAAQRAGLFRRIILRDASPRPTGYRDGRPDVLDLSESPASIAEAHLRIQRLELGMQLIAETLKRSYGRLTAAIQELGARTPMETSVEEVQRVVSGALEPVAASLGEVAETLRRFPLLVAAAADHVTDRVEAARTVVEESTRSPSRPLEPVPVLPIVPFELEPVDDEFDTLTALRRARFAVDDLDDEWVGAAAPSVGYG